MSTRKLTLEEKVKIVQESEQSGFTETALKYCKRVKQKLSDKNG